MEIKVVTDKTKKKKYLKTVIPIEPGSSVKILPKGKSITHSKQLVILTEIK